MQQNLNEWRKDIQVIINKISRKQIVELLYNFFEVNENPEIIAISRKITSVSGYAKIDKKIFQFSIIFLLNNDKLEMVIDLNLTRQGLTKAKEIIVKENENRIDVFLADNNQYLFSVSL